MVPARGGRGRAVASWGVRSLADLSRSPQGRWVLLAAVALLTFAGLELALGESDRERQTEQAVRTAIQRCERGGQPIDRPSRERREASTVECEADDDRWVCRYGEGAGIVFLPMADDHPEVSLIC